MVVWVSKDDAQAPYIWWIGAVVAQAEETDASRVRVLESTCKYVQHSPGSCYLTRVLHKYTAGSWRTRLAGDARAQVKLPSITAYCSCCQRRPTQSPLLFYLTATAPGMSPYRHTVSRIVFLTLVSALVAAQDEQKPFDCHITSGEDQYDLTSLAGEHAASREVQQPPSVLEEKVTFNLCEDLKRVSSIPDDDQVRRHAVGA